MLTMHFVDEDMQMGLISGTTHLCLSFPMSWDGLNHFSNDDLILT